MYVTIFYRTCVDIYRKAALTSHIIEKKKLESPEANEAEAMTLCLPVLSRLRNILLLESTKNSC